MTRLKVPTISASWMNSLSRWRQVIQGYDFATDIGMGVQGWDPQPRDSSFAITATRLCEFYVLPNRMCRFALDIDINVTTAVPWLLLTLPADPATDFLNRAAGPGHLFKVSTGVVLGCVTMVFGDTSFYALAQPNANGIAVERCDGTNFAVANGFALAASGEYKVANTVVLT